MDPKYSELTPSWNAVHSGNFHSSWENFYPSVYELVEFQFLSFHVIKWSPNHVILLIKEWSVCIVRAVLVDYCLPIVNSGLLKAVELSSGKETSQ